MKKRAAPERVFESWSKWGTTSCTAVYSHSCPDIFLKQIHQQPVCAKALSAEFLWFRDQVATHCFHHCWWFWSLSGKPRLAPACHIILTYIYPFSVSPPFSLSSCLWVFSWGGMSSFSDHETIPHPSSPFISIWITGWEKLENISPSPFFLITPKQTAVALCECVCVCVSVNQPIRSAVCWQVSSHLLSGGPCRYPPAGRDLHLHCCLWRLTG